MTPLVYLADLARLTGIPLAELRVLRRHTGGQWAVHRTSGEGSRGGAVPLDDVIGWCRRVLVPWSNDREHRVVACAHVVQR